jgi:hypothetical protein
MIAPYFVLFTKHYCSDQLKEEEMGGACSTSREVKNSYSILVRKPEGKRPLKIPRHRREVNIKMVPGETGWKCVEWIHRALGNSVMNFWDL